MIKSINKTSIIAPAEVVLELQLVILIPPFHLFKVFYGNFKNMFIYLSYLLQEKNFFVII